MPSSSATAVPVCVPAVVIAMSPSSKTPGVCIGLTYCWIPKPGELTRDRVGYGSDALARRRAHPPRLFGALDIGNVDHLALQRRIAGLLVPLHLHEIHGRLRQIARHRRKARVIDDDDLLCA